MLTDFHNSFTDRLSGKRATNRVQMSQHTLAMSLHYLVKYLFSKNCYGQEVTEANCHARLRHSKKTLLKYLYVKIFIL